MRLKETEALVFFVTVLMQVVTVRGKTCGPGLMLKNGLCVECPKGTYNDHHGHNDTACKFCPIPNECEKVSEECTPLKPGSLTCRADCFRDETGNCSHCSECGQGKLVNRPFLRKHCSISHDTVCCKGDQEMAILIDNRYECVYKGGEDISKAKKSNEAFASIPQ